jgi:hypothetical protein
VIAPAKLFVDFLPIRLSLDAGPAGAERVGEESLLQPFIVERFDVGPRMEPQAWSPAEQIEYGRFPAAHGSADLARGAHATYEMKS